MPEFLFAQKGIGVSMGSGAETVMLIVLAIIATAGLIVIAISEVVGIVYLIRGKKRWAKAIAVVLMLLPIIFAFVLYVTGLPSGDYVKVKRGGYVVWGELTAGKYLRQFLCEVEPYDWTSLTEGDRAKAELSPQELAEILGRHPELERAVLGPRSYQPVVMHQLAALPNLYSVEL